MAPAETLGSQRWLTLSQRPERRLQSQWCDSGSRARAQREVTGWEPAAQWARPEVKDSGAAIQGQERTDVPASGQRPNSPSSLCPLLVLSGRLLLRRLCLSHPSGNVPCLSFETQGFLTC